LLHFSCIGQHDEVFEFLKPTFNTKVVGNIKLGYWKQKNDTTMISETINKYNIKANKIELSTAVNNSEPKA